MKFNMQDVEGKAMLHALDFAWLARCLGAAVHELDHRLYL